MIERTVKAPVVTGLGRAPLGGGDMNNVHGGSD